MKPVYQRIIAIILMCLPGVLAIYGWTTMRDVLFNYTAGQPFAVLQFLGALAAFIIGLAIVGGFIFHRDKKRNKIQPWLLGQKPDPTQKRKPGY